MKFPTTQEGLIQWLRLIRTPKVGAIGFRSLLAQHGSASAAIDYLPSIKGAHLVVPSRSQALREIENLEKIGGRMVCYGAPEYPVLLACTRDAPPILSVIGRKDLLTTPMLAIVGSRNSSINGHKITRTIVNDLQHYSSAQGIPYTIISGMALGIDGVAHAAAMSYGTIGVVANGIDIIYPKKNTDLFTNIKEMGVLISECALGDAPTPRMFPRRNRIIAGCAVGVLVVEATLKSGSMITASIAGDYGREVMAVPGSPIDQRSCGVNRLLRDGAGLVTSAEDVIAFLGQSPGLLAESRSLFDDQQQTPYPEPPWDDLWHNLQNSHDSDEDHTNEDLLGDEEPTNPIDSKDRILTLLGPTPVSVNALVRELELPTHRLLSYLVELELEERVQFVAGGDVVRLN